MTRSGPACGALALLMVSSTANARPSQGWLHARKATTSPQIPPTSTPPGSTGDDASAPASDDDAPVSDPSADFDREVDAKGTDGVIPSPPAADAAHPDDLWQWVSKLQGDVPDPETVKETREHADERAAEMALADQLGGGDDDVPLDFYKDPGKALTADPLHLDKVDPSEFDIPVVVNEDVAKWVRYFTGPGRTYYTHWLQRSTRYRPLELAELQKQGLPKDLVYLSMIESGYLPSAYSTAEAAGLWQFIPSTARLYRLRVDFYVDERRDPELETRAGAEFLGDLYQMFGDWNLAFAGYNGGPGRVKRAEQLSGSKDFWTMSHGNYFEPETQDYVPKIVAAAIIGHHPERYGFTDIAYQPELTYDTAHVDGNVQVPVIAKCANMSLADFQALNPALRRLTTPPEGFDVRVAKGGKDDFVAALDLVPMSQRVALAEHRVGRGESLATIARKYGVSSADLAAANGLRDGARVLTGTVLAIPAGAVGAPASAVRDDEKVAELGGRSVNDVTPATITYRPRYHTVRRGETLSEISANYGVSMSQVKAWNHHGNTVYTGETLRVGTIATNTAAAKPAAAPASAPVPVAADAPVLVTADLPRAAAPAPKPQAVVAPKPAAAPAPAKVTYTVHRGDTLSGIASRYGVSMSNIQKWNGMHTSTVQLGQTLVIHPPAVQWTHYTVRSGDNLTLIARKYACDVSDLCAWNGIDGDVIVPGQDLKIRK